MNASTLPSPPLPLGVDELSHHAEALGELAKRLGSADTAIELSPAQRAALDICACELARVSIILAHHFLGEPSSGVVTPGICMQCGCTDMAACAGGCSWANATHTLCSRCVR